MDGSWMNESRMRRGVKQRGEKLSLFGVGGGGGGTV